MHKWPLGYTDKILSNLKEIERDNNESNLSQYFYELFPEREDRELYRCRVFDLLLKGGLSNYHLWAVDRSSMWHGFEVRVPYLHDDVVEIATMLPISERISGDVTKVILRRLAMRVFSNYSLDDVLTREKCAMPDSINHIIQTSEVLELQ